MDKHDMRPECAANFSALNTTLKSFDKTLDGVRDDLRRQADQGRTLEARVAELDNSSRGAWNTLRNEVLPAIKDAPILFRDGMADHRSQCVAYLQATQPSSKRPSMGWSSKAILKWILWVSVALGGLAAGIAGGSVEFDKQDAPVIKQVQP